MSDTQVFIQDFFSRATKGEAEMPPSLIEEVKEACGQALEKQFSREPNEFRLRLSGIGQP